jgi:ATP-dependent RNA helicase RhlE
VTTFADLGLTPPLLKALAAEGYTTPTPIQAQAIPPVAAGRDLVGIAQTGTGKTAAFALPILQRLAASNARPAPRACRALILAPTRELATQITDSFGSYGRNHRLSRQVVFGGVSLNNQIRALHMGVDILVATPGRLLDLIDRRALSIANVEIVVLDEADHMLDLGFIHAIRKITKMLPARRQTLLFSATMPAAIQEIADALLTDPVRVAVTPVAKTADKVAQSVIMVDQSGKGALLAALANERDVTRGIVFSRTKHGADRIVKVLAKDGIEAVAIHGNKSQNQRERALDGFRSGRIRLLVATDIAARGIDVDGLSHVFNYDLPDVPETYVHRIGRTARAGATGIAIAFCAKDEVSNLRAIERLTKTPIPVVEHDLGGRWTAPESGAQAADAGRGARKPPQRRPERRAPGAAPVAPTTAKPQAGTGPRQPRHRRDDRADDRRDQRRDDRRDDRRDGARATSATEPRHRGQPSGNHGLPAGLVAAPHRRGGAAGGSPVNSGSRHSDQQVKSRPRGAR